MACPKCEGEGCEDGYAVGELPLNPPLFVRGSSTAGAHFITMSPSICVQKVRAETSDGENK